MISALHWSVLNADKITDQESLKEASETLKRWLRSESESAPYNWCVKQSPEHLWRFMLKDKKNKANTVLDVRLHEIGAAKWDCPIAENDFEIIWMSAF
jgi:3-dehydroquinate synthetase